MAKFSPPEDDEFEINGEKVFIPRGTNIGWASNGIQRDKAVFGEDANSFMPERWGCGETGTDAQGRGFEFWVWKVLLPWETDCIVGAA
jgi:cytochrome P450